MVGEIRDRETADIAIRAALTGHFVYSTLHTNDAPSAITRLTDMGVENYLITSSLVAVLAQRLVRVDLPRSARLPAGTAMTPEGDTIETFRGAGCENCFGTGYPRPRRNLRADGVGAKSSAHRSCATRTPPRSPHCARRHGMRNLREDGWDEDPSRSHYGR